MAIDFPVPGFLGETYKPPSSDFTYQWNGIAWTVQSGNAGGAPTVSDSPPTSPLAGQQWYQSSTGRLCIYYFDGNQSQWVEEGPGAVLLATQGAYAWGVTDESGALLNDFNVTSVVRLATGRYEVTMDTPAVVNPYVVQVTSQRPGGAFSPRWANAIIGDASVFEVQIFNDLLADADGAFSFTVFT